MQNRSGRDGVSLAILMQNRSGRDGVSLAILTQNRSGRDGVSLAILTQNRSGRDGVAFGVTAQRLLPLPPTPNPSFLPSVHLGLGSPTAPPREAT